MDRNELKDRIDSTPVLSDLPDSKAMEEVHEVLKHPGLYHLWGLLLGARQAWFVALSQAPAGSLAEIQRVGVIQGTIRGIELFRDTVLEQGVSSDAPNEGAR